MSTKTLSITTEAYDRLKANKKHKESFTDVINRLTRKKSLLGFAGMLSKDEAEILENAVKKSRNESEQRLKWQK